MEWLNKFAQNPQVEVAGRTVPIALRRHPAAKRLTMRVAPDGTEIRITMPRWGQSREAVAFAQSRLGWLELQLAAAARSNPSVRPVGHGATIPLRGADHVIAWDRHLPRAPVPVEGTIRIGGPEAGIAARLERWLRAQGLSMMESDLAQYCANAGVPTPRLSLSRARRRWGSCSSSGVVRINWRLIMAPDHVRRSVVAHEVAHLVHFDHSPAFHALLADLFEGDLAGANSWLKASGRGLYSHFG